MRAHTHMRNKHTGAPTHPRTYALSLALSLYLCMAMHRVLRLTLGRVLLCHQLTSQINPPNSGYELAA